MGYMRHHAIVVTSYGVHVSKAHSKAKEIFPWVSDISPEVINGYQSFFVPPDGSKEGWKDSSDGDDLRNKYIEWLNGERYKDGSSPIGWVEVRFDDDEKDAAVERCSDWPKEWKR